MKTTLALSLLLLCGCPGGDDTGKADDTALGTDAVAVCTPTHTDGYTLNSLTVTGDALALDVSYGGGCETHAFQLCWDGSFLESDPVQAALVLGHDAHDDPCDAYLSETLSFDLSPLKAAWQDAYHGETGTVILDLADQTGTYSF